MKKYEDNELEDIQVSQSLACYVPNWLNEFDTLESESNKSHSLDNIFYGQHDGNNKNSIWKLHSNFAFLEPYYIK
jgi:hypothetical protein